MNAMHVQFLKAYGGPDVKPGTVLVRIAAAAINQIDVKIRSGLPIGPDLPAILGADLAGVVQEVGPGVVDLKAGDECMAVPAA